MATAAAGLGDRVSGGSLIGTTSDREPLAIALQIKRGDTPVVAKEVMEVAMDIANSTKRSGRTASKPAE